MPNPTRVVLFGDSAVWGTGLKPPDKISGWLERSLPSRVKDTVKVTNHAQTGAGIGLLPSVLAGIRVFGNSPTALPAQTLFGGPLPTLISVSQEIPGSVPTIAQQIGAFARTPDPDVDIVVLDGGINDVNVLEILLSASDAALDAAIELRCEMEMGQLLALAADRFPNARIVVNGYWPILSDDSTMDGIRAVVCAAASIPNGLVTDMLNVPLIPIEKVVKDALVANATRFHESSRIRLRNAVATANATIGTVRGMVRVQFVDPGFGPENAVGAGTPWLFGIGADGKPQDQMVGERAALCDANADFLSHFKCIFASIGHPNREGARQIAGEIVKALTRSQPFPVSWVERGVNMVEHIEGFDNLAKNTITEAQTIMATEALKLFTNQAKVTAAAFEDAKAQAKKASEASASVASYLKQAEDVMKQAAADAQKASEDAAKAVADRFHQ
jgi:hypothetical protein